MNNIKIKYIVKVLNIFILIYSFFLFYNCSDLSEISNKIKKKDDEKFKIKQEIDDDDDKKFNKLEPIKWDLKIKEFGKIDYDLLVPKNLNLDYSINVSQPLFGIFYTPNHPAKVSNLVENIESKLGYFVLDNYTNFDYINKNKKECLIYLNDVFGIIDENIDCFDCCILFVYTYQGGEGFFYLETGEIVYISEIEKLFYKNMKLHNTNLIIFQTYILHRNKLSIDNSYQNNKKLLYKYGKEDLSLSLIETKKLSNISFPLEEFIKKKLDSKNHNNYDKINKTKIMLTPNYFNIIKKTKITMNSKIEQLKNEALDLLKKNDVTFYKLYNKKCKIQNTNRRLKTEVVKLKEKIEDLNKENNKLWADNHQLSVELLKNNSKQTKIIKKLQDRSVGNFLNLKDKNLENFKKEMTNINLDNEFDDFIDQSEEKTDIQ